MKYIKKFENTSDDIDEVMDIFQEYIDEYDMQEFSLESDPNFIQYSIKYTNYIYEQKPNNHIIMNLYSAILDRKEYEKILNDIFKFIKRLQLAGYKITTISGDVINIKDFYINSRMPLLDMYLKIQKNN